MSQSLAYKCWRKDPKLRPSFAEITAHLTSHLMAQAGSTWAPAGDSYENMTLNMSQNLESMGLQSNHLADYASEEDVE